MHQHSTRTSRRGQVNGPQCDFITQRSSNVAKTALAPPSVAEGFESALDSLVRASSAIRPTPALLSPSAISCCQGCFRAGRSGGSFIMDINVNVNVRAIEKLVDYLASGIGSTASFFFSRMVARRNAKARGITAEGEAEAHRILTEGRAASMQIVAAAQAEARSKLISPQAALQGEVIMGELIEQRVQFQEEKRQANIGSVATLTAQELGDREVQDHEVDHDWTARFFRDVQDVSSEEMQQLWAKVLAGEIIRPGRFSLRTLNTLHNMSVGEARLFAEACNYVVKERMIIYTDDMHVMGNNLHLGNILKLTELGLIMSDSDLTYTAHWDEIDRDWAFHKGRLSFPATPGALSTLEFPTAKLTTVGKELFGLVELQEDVDILYLKLLARFLAQHKRKLRYVVGENITEIDP